MIPRDAHARYERRFDPIAYFGASNVAVWLAARDKSAGAITSWIDRAHGYDFAGTATRDTAINGMPTITGNGTSNILTSTAAISQIGGASAVTVIAALSDTSTAALAMIYESSPNWATAGRFGAYVQSAGGQLRSNAMGDVGATAYVITESLATPIVLTCQIDFALATGEASLFRRNGSVVASTMVNNSNNGGTFGSNALNLFARNGGSFWWAGSMTELLVIGRTMTVAEMLRCERMIGRSSKIGV